MKNNVDKGKMLTHCSLSMYYSNKNERNLVAWCYKSGIFKYNIWLQTEQKSITDAPVGIYLVLLLKHISRRITNAYDRDIY